MISEHCQLKKTINLIDVIHLSLSCLYMLLIVICETVQACTKNTPTFWYFYKKKKKEKNGICMVNRSRFEFPPRRNIIKNGYCVICKKNFPAPMKKCTYDFHRWPKRIVDFASFWSLRRVKMFLFLFNATNLKRNHSNVFYDCAPKNNFKLRKICV